MYIHNGQVLATPEGMVAETRDQWQVHFVEATTVSEDTEAGIQDLGTIDTAQILTIGEGIITDLGDFRHQNGGEVAAILEGSFGNRLVRNPHAANGAVTSVFERCIGL